MVEVQRWEGAEIDLVWGLRERHNEEAAFLLMGDG